MLYPGLEKRLHNAKHALSSATSENIIELCKQYLALLAEYRGKLHKSPNDFSISFSLESPLSQETIDNTRKAIRVAIEDTTRERNRTASLLHSFTAVSGYEAVETLNRRKYKGHDDWTLSAGGVKFGDSTDGERMTIQEAVDTTSLLRREEHIATNRLPSILCQPT